MKNFTKTSNKNLKTLIESGKFREDLFYRLNVVPIYTPPLRDRIEDIPELVEHFLNNADKSGLPIKKINNSAINSLMSQAKEAQGNVQGIMNGLTSFQDGLQRYEIEKRASLVKHLHTRLY